MKKTTGIHFIGVLLLFFVLLSCVQEVGAVQYLTASGCSVSNVGYLTELADEFERRTGVKVFVRGGGSVAGIQDLRSGKVDFAAACRAKDEDDPADLKFIQVAWDALVFIVHKTNPVDSISLEQGKKIFMGDITNWSQMKGNYLPIKVFFSRPGKGLSGVEASVQSLILKGTKRISPPRVLYVPSSAIVEQMVEDSPEGFAASGFTSARRRNVRMLKINGVSPSVQNIISDRYPLKRPLFLIVPANPKPQVTRFIDFTLSGEGQRFISSLGVVSLHDMEKK